MPDLPPGLYEELVTDGLDRRLRLVDPALVERGPLDPGDAHEVLARHLGELAQRASRAVSGESQEPDGDLGAPPYLYAGPATCVSHSGERPMRILWRLGYELPADVFHAARVAAG
jgi:hypothetical protein